VNGAAKPGGHLQVELQDDGGRPIKGFSLSDCDAFCGDEIEHTVTWNGKSDLGDLAGQTLRLRIVLKDADLFSIQFAPGDAPGT
jgi:hypothetical protein